MSRHRLIAADWGTTNLRAFRLAADGRVVERRDAPAGILNVPEGRFEDAFDQALGDWLAAWPAAPVVLSGMIGSRQGWRESPYVDCPAGAPEIAARAVPITSGSGRQVWILPGLVVRDPGGTPDVMRGEETQILGAFEGAAGDRRLCCLPGTHSKWALIEDGRILGFRTAMTGEVFATLIRHSILGRLIEGEEHHAEAFDRGLGRADEPGGLLHHLFGTRSLGLTGELPPAALASYLSGILIGHDVSHGPAAVPGEAPIVLVGAGALTERYARAFERRGRTAIVIDGASAAARGLWRLGRLMFEA
ncbi:MAG: 2-dehydro-3-deoxygalactonokinase [Kiloniellales bacterium]